MTRGTAKTANAAGSAGDYSDSSLLMALCEGVPDYLCICDAERRIRWANRVHPSLTPEEVIGRRVDEFLSEEARAIFEPNFTRTLETGEPTSHLIRAELAGQEIWIEHRLIRERPDAVLLITRDVTAKCAAERASDDNQRVIHEVIEHYPDIIMIIEPSGVVLETNDVTAGSLGTTRAAMIGSVAWELMPPEVGARRRAYAKEVCDAKQPLRRTDSSGGRVFDSVGYPILDADGEVRAIAVVSRDVTEQKQAEEILRQKENRRWRSEKMEGLGVLAAGVAHDFNNLLTPILVNTSAAADPDCGAERRTRLLAATTEAAERATRLIRQILIFGAEGETQACISDLCHTLRETLSFMRASLPSDINVVGELPDEPIWLHMDVTQIDQAIVNLCINAGQAMAKKGGLLTLAVERHERPTLGGLSSDPHVCIVISDTGPGIDEQTQRRIFDPFFSTKSPDQGSGLGLFVVHSVAANHNGLVTVDSTPGKGTRFSLWLPCASDAQPEAPPPAPAELPAVGPLRILLLEDEDLVRAAAAMILESGDHRVTGFSTCQEAVRGFALAPLEYDIAMLDQRLGDGSGLDVALRLQELRPGLPILLCSGHMTSEVKSSCLTHGFTVLAKPYTPSMLLQAVSLACSGDNIRD